MRPGLVASIACCALLAAGIAVAAGARDFTTTGVVTYVVDGDTLDVRLSNGARERVRLIGVDTPERGDCGAAEATSAARRLALGKAVVLRGDSTQDTRDRYGRLLAYVWLPHGKDLGFQLVAGGHASVYVYDRPFRRVAAYRSGEAAARGKGLRRCGSIAPASSDRAARSGGGGGCATGYVPCLPAGRDLDCGEIRDSLKPIRVSGGDPYRLDGDDDGWGCE